MKQFFLISLLIISLLVDNSSCTTEKIPPERKIADVLLLQVDSFASWCDKLQIAASRNGADEKELQQIFLQARSSYKKFEWAAEYFEPLTSRAVNGPPVPEVEPTGQVLEPTGLQVMENWLYPVLDKSKIKQLSDQARFLKTRCAIYKTHFDKVPMFDWQVFDASKLEVFRIITLGIAGFDDPLSLKCMEESAISLRSVQGQLAIYMQGNDDEHLKEKINSSISVLVAGTNFNDFDRAVFIKSYANPITIAISDAENKLQLHPATYNRLLNQQAKTLFDSNAFNVNAFSQDPSAFITAKKIHLGAELFQDPSLSGNGVRSCRSCHQPEKAFTDGLIKNTTIDSRHALARNTPTLINAALQPSQFYDLRVRTLEDQSRAVVQSEEEMHGSMNLSVQKLWQNEKYRRLFSEAFPKPDRMGIDTFEVMNAIGSYVRSLVFLNSRFDEFMRGKSSALTAEELKGFNLFMGKARCGTCHYMPLFNGSFPPRYMKIETEVIGVPGSLVKNEIDKDPGRYGIIKAESLKHAFKIPTVRNISRTAPYMHNGVFSTLDQVVNFYNKGGGAGLGLNLNNQTLPTDSLRLSKNEQQDLIAFMKSLDSK
jgi:cytochrome c peroxidase